MKPGKLIGLGDLIGRYIQLKLIWHELGVKFLDHPEFLDELALIRATLNQETILVIAPGPAEKSPPEGTC